MTRSGFFARGRSLAVLMRSLFFTTIIFLPAVFLSEEITAIAKEGLMLSFGTVIPSVFPFIILTDFAVRYIHFESVARLRRLFERIFKINGCGLSAFISGILGGFPLGAHRSIELYKSGKISKDECERLIGFANNASPGYIICAVGGGLLGSVKVGILLYFITILSSVISGAVMGIKKDFSEERAEIAEQKYSFVASVKSAAAICISIAAFITAFTILGGVIGLMVKAPSMKILLLPIFEIGSAAAYISKSGAFSRLCAITAISFSISFSGLSVYAQTASLTEGSGISMMRYVITKLICGLISAATAFLFFLLVDFFF